MHRQISQTPSADNASAFSRYFPKADDWMKRRKLVRELSAESAACAAEARTWEGRGHWEMAGRLYEKGACHLERSLDIQYDGERRRGMESLLRSAMVSLRLEMTEAARYDPALHWRMSRVARALGEPKMTVEHFKKACNGFSLVVCNRSVESLVGLNRLKRRFIEEVWEGPQERAFATAAEAIALSRRITTSDGKVSRENDTRKWLENQYSARYGEPYLLLSAI